MKVVRKLFCFVENHYHHYQGLIACSLLVIYYFIKLNTEKKTGFVGIRTYYFFVRVKDKIKTGPMERCSKVV
jgi:hypothetical protein